MKVTLFSDMQAEGFLSMNIYAEELTRHLQEAGLEAQEFSVEPPKLPYRLRNIGRFVGRYVTYPWKMQKARADVNHVTDHSYGFLTYFLPRQSCVVTCHDLTPLHISLPSWQVRLKRQLWKMAFRGTLRAPFIIADSQNTKHDILTFSKYPSERIVVVYPGLETRFRLLRGTPSQQDWEKKFRAQHGLGTAPFILHVGRYSPRKNFEGVLQSFARLIQKVPEVRLIQVGGQFQTEHFLLMQKLAITERVTQLSFVPRDELPHIYSAAAALLFPSYYEGFGWPPIEAMACGTPVVASNLTSIPEVVGEAALLFEPDDWEGQAAALAGLITDLDLRDNMVKRGLARASEFSWTRCAHEVSQVYSRLLALEKGTGCD